jgi:hypothetical protein
MVRPSPTLPVLWNSHPRLSSSIIQDILDLHNVEKASIAYFYFDFRDANKQKLHDLLPSLLIQLSSRSDPCCDILSQLYSAHDRGVRKPSDHAMIECLKKGSPTRSKALLTSLWTHSMNAQLFLVFHLLGKRSLSSSMNLLTFTSQIFIYALQVGLNSTSRLSSNR